MYSLIVSQLLLQLDMNNVMQKLSAILTTWIQLFPILRMALVINVM
jgi:hypothetical protein